MNYYNLPPFLKNNLFPLSILFVPLLLYFIYTKSRRITKLAHLPKNFKNFQFKAFVTKVGDGDGFKAIHIPLIRFSSNLKGIESLSIRLAGIDAPEVRYFNRPEQPFSKESKEELTKLILNKKVKIKVLNIDRYNRIIGMVYLKKNIFKYFNVNIEMIRKGMACVYLSSITSFGGIKEEFLKEEKKAKTKKIGIWSDPNFILPQLYKNNLNKVF